MPSLKFIIGGDASPFAQAMKTVEASASGAGTRTMAEFRKAAAEIEKARANILEMGGSTKFYDTALQHVNNQMFRLEQSTFAAKMATDALALSQAKVATGMGDAADRLAARGVPRGMSETEFDKSMLSGSQVTRKGPMEDQLRRLRAQMAMGGADEAAARAEIRKLVAMRAATSSTSTGMIGGRGSLGASTTMLVSAARDSLASLASGQNPLTIFLQQAPQVAQAATMVKGGVSGMWLAFKNLLSMKIGMFGSIAGIFAGIAAGAIAAKYHTDKLIASLSGIKTPDFDPQYVPKHLKATNAIVEGWKAVAEAARKAREEYDSASAAASRQSQKTNTEFEHKKKMLNLQKEIDMAGARSPSAKFAVSERFRSQELALEESRRKAEMRDAEKANVGFFNESVAMQNRANAIKVPSQISDQNNLGNIQNQLKAANEAAAAVMEARNAGGVLGVNGRKAFQTYNSMTNSGVSTEDLVAAENAILTKRSELRKAERDTIDRNAANDKQREEKARLSGKAQEAAGKFVTGSAEIKDKASAANEQARMQSEEAALQSRLDKKSMSGSGGGYSMELTSNQKIGAFSAGPQLGMLDVANKQLTELRAINTKLGNSGSNNQPIMLGGKRTR